MEIVREGGGNGGENLILSGGTFVDAVGEEGGCFWGYSSSKGKVVKLESEALDAQSLESVPTRGNPTSVAVDTETGRVYVADVEHGAIMLADGVNNSCVPVVQDYEGRRLLGPSSIAFENGTLFFTDSGPLGESSIESPNGSVFAITNDENGMILRPLSVKCFAHPTGICAAGENIYVCETLKNRILRFNRRPHGSYICSVLHQFSGRLGPSAIAFDSETNQMYVARYDFDGQALISVIDPSGAQGGHIRDIEIQEIGAQITDLTINHESKELYIFEATSGNVVRLSLG